MNLTVLSVTRDLRPELNVDFIFLRTLEQMPSDIGVTLNNNVPNAFHLYDEADNENKCLIGFAPAEGWNFGDQIIITSLSLGDQTVENYI